MYPFDIAGIVKGVDTTKNGQIYYSVLTTRDVRCGGPKHYLIAVFPSMPAASCTVGKHAKASGTYFYDCFEGANGIGRVCMAELGYKQDAALTCH